MNFDVALFSSKPMHAELDLLSPVRRVLESEWFILGQEVTAFETEFASYCGVADCVSVANGTDALELALKAVGVSPGDSVWLAANAGFYGSTAAQSFGAIPFYIDVDAATMVVTAAHLERAVGPTPKAVIITHLFGQLAEMEPILEWARARGVAVIEDCAQAHGASRGGRRAGSWGDLSCFSFYPTKNLGALGDGGAVCTSRSDLASKLRQLRTYGWTRKYSNDVEGGKNSRLDEMQAAILRVKLPHLDSWNEQRRAIAKQYVLGLKGVRVQASTGLDHVSHLFVIRTPNRDKLKTHLAEALIHSDVHYPIADHRQTVSRGRRPRGVLPVTEAACDTVLTLPCYPGLTAAAVDHVIACVNKWTLA